MDAQRWQQIERLFHAVVDRSAAERAALLDRDCGSDPGLRDEVESLLAAHEQAASSFIDECPFKLAVRPRAARRGLLEPGRRIGRYTLRGVLGRGATGIVYEAEQDQPARIVALKVMQPLAYADTLAIRMFRREGRALARLDHPGIGAIYEAGQEDGYCYFAMERVEGAPLTVFAAEQRLGLRQRLELFERVCAAVQYAHQRGVIHRDLKPSNILVTPAGQPKVLDFGLARIIEPDGERTELTEPGAFLGTLLYASPEQARGGEIDTSSDVYALGVILYELLAGRAPLELKGLPLPEAARVICEQPPRPLAAAAPALRGELATIVHKALEKAPTRRYGSAAALAEDLRRYLQREPILAHPPSAGYQLRKLIERHRAASITAGLGALVVITFAAAMTVLFQQSQAHLRAAEAARGDALIARQQARDEAQRANASAAEAQQQARTSDRVRQLISEILAALPPRRVRNQAVAVHEVLAAAQERVLTGLADEPQVKAELLLQLGTIQSLWGYFDKARPMLETALALQQQHGGKPSERRKTLGTLAMVCFNLGDGAAAEPLIDAVLDELDQAPEPDLEELEDALVLKGRILRGRTAYLEALACFDRALELHHRRLPNDERGALHTNHQIAKVKAMLGEWEEAQHLLEHVVEVQQRTTRRPDSPDIAEPMRDLGALQRTRGQFEQSEVTLRDAWERLKRYLGPESPRTIGTLYELTLTLQAAGKFAEAETLLRETLAAVREPPLSIRVALATLLMRCDRFEEAEPILRECLDSGSAGADWEIRRARAMLELCRNRQRPPQP